MSQAKLSDAILALSFSKEWPEAIKEWELTEIYEAREPATCLCGHHPIHDMCKLSNIKNGKQADLGNCCVKKFIGLPSEAIFSALRRVRENSDKSLGEDALAYAKTRGWLTDWEIAFYRQISRQKRMSDLQQEKKHQINFRFQSAVLNRMPMILPKSKKPCAPKDEPPWDHEG